MPHQQQMWSVNNKEEWISSMSTTATKHFRHPQQLSHQHHFFSTMVNIKNTKNNVDDDFWSREDIAPTTLEGSKIDAHRRLEGMKQKYPIDSDAATATSTGELLFPSTRHSSRHFPGPLCSYDELHSLTDTFLRREYGSLYQVTSSSSTLSSSSLALEDNEKENDEEYHIFQLREQVEFLMRGHSACLKDSYLQRQVKHLLVDMTSEETPDFIKERIEKSRMCYNNQYFDSLKESTKKSAPEEAPFETLIEITQNHLTTMIGLLERLEEEADLYWIRKQSQLVLDKQEATYDPNMKDAEYMNSTSSSFKTDTEEELSADMNGSGTTDAKEGVTNAEEGEANEEEMKSPTGGTTMSDQEKNAKATLWKECGPPPGPSTKMYDMILDGYASLMKLFEECNKTPNEQELLKMIRDIRKIQFRAIRRYEYDGEASNTNPHTMLTAMTWNAPLRALSYVPFDANVKDASEPIRDAALDYAMHVFVDTNERNLRDSSIQKNGASYVYMLRILNKFIPHSRSKGNMARGIFEMCCIKDQCVTQDVWDVMMNEYKPNTAGPDFLEYQKTHKEKDMLTLSKLPKKWQQRNRISRYQLWDDGTY